MAGEQVLVIVEDSTPALTDLHVLKTGLHTIQQKAEMLNVLRELETLSPFTCKTYCELCGKWRRWAIVTNGWLRVLVGVILLSASSVSIFFSRSMNSLLSAFSAKMSVPSKLLMLTWSETHGVEWNHSAISHSLYLSICFSNTESLMLRVIVELFASTQGLDVNTTVCEWPILMPLFL